MRRPFGDHPASLVELLTLERVEVDMFRGWSPLERRARVYGGQVCAQALMAAAATVDTDHAVHSLHAYFLLGGDTSAPILYRVHRIRDGRSFTTRRVVAIQHGRAIFSLSASFHRSEPGPEHTTRIDLSSLPAPGTLPRRRWGHALDDIREIDRGEPERPGRRLWMRVPHPLGDDPVLHAAAVAYMSDHGPIGAVRNATGGHHGDGLMRASLDHAIWFHAPVRADGWLLFDLQAVVATGARGLAWGTIHDATGVAVATVAQEALGRPGTRPR